MQDNPFDDQFMEGAWQDMHAKLNEVMPERRKRRVVIWWWLGAAVLAGLLVGYFTQRPASVVPEIAQEISADQPAESEIVDLTREKVHEEVVRAVIESSDTVISATNNIVTERAASSKKLDIDHLLTDSKSSSAQPLTSQASAKKTELAEIDKGSDRYNLVLVPLASRNDPVQRRDSLILSFTQSENSLQSKNKIKKIGKANIYAQSDYEPYLSTFNLAGGVGWQQSWNRWSLRVDPGIQFGNAEFVPARSNEEMAFAEADRDNNSPGTGTSFQPGVSNVQVQAVSFRFANFRLPVSIGYDLNDKWSIEGGLLWNTILSMKSSQSLNEPTLDVLYSGNSGLLAEATAPETDLTTLLRQRSYWQGQLATNYQLGKRWEVYAAYQYAFGDALVSDQLQWDRNYLTLGLRYEINSYIFGKK